ncbi:hypothetical protein [Amycolatopsis sp.]|uniref:hypothetical protein n=1 Tax=Amycolatopsis sp. TaxID=37632 RepID=UPI002BE70083|nr:hypothetical protein [Amycolatopsis sp.]HVV12024.1 hypothetical protein [Amycolatopsis sp.]
MTTNDNQGTNRALWTWVESGLTDGTLWYSPGQEQGFLNFWADGRPDGSYNEHYIGPASTDSYNTAAFYWVTNTNNWDVYFNSVKVGTSADVGAFAGGGENGIESLTPNMEADGDTYGWSYADPSNNWHDVSNDPFYNNSNGILTGYSDGPTVHAQTAQGCSFPSSATAAPADVTAGTAATTAGRLARALGESQPGAMQYVKTSRQRAATATSGESVNSDNSVYVVQMSGKFTVPAARIPKGAKAPTGSRLTVTINSTSGQVQDWSISNTDHDLARLGTVSPIQ